MKLDIIDISSLVEQQWSLQLKEAEKKITNSTSRGVGKVRYTALPFTNHQNYHAYVESLVSELDVSLTPGERGARTHSKGRAGKILFSAGTKHELISTFHKIIDILQQLYPDVSCTSWGFHGKKTVKENVCLDDVKTEMDLAYK